MGVDEPLTPSRDDRQDRPGRSRRKESIVGDVREVLDETLSPWVKVNRQSGATDRVQHLFSDVEDG